MKKNLLVVAVQMLAIGAFAQPALKITKESHDFGTIVEGTQASFTFDIQNSGNQTLIISNVQPSCGCTTPEWTKDPIHPGAKGQITATFNSSGRPGSFNKAITVTSNSVEPTRILTIKGFVAPVVKKEYTEEEKKNSPIVSLERSEFNFGKVQVGQNIHQKVKMTNKGKGVLKFSGVQSGCYCVSYTLTKQEIAAGETVDLELIYNVKNQGEQTDIVTLATNDIVTADPKITLKANVEAGFGNNSLMNQGGAAVPFK